MSRLRELLEDTRTLISDPERWTQGSFAVNRVGETVNPDAPVACRWCLMGAVVACQQRPEDFTGAVQVLTASLPSNFRDAFPGGPSVRPTLIRYNDQREHADVIALLDEAIEHCDGVAA